MLRDVFCDQTSEMSMVSGMLPNSLGTYSLCPTGGVAKYCLAFAMASRDRALVGFCVPAACEPLEIAAHIAASPLLNASFRYQNLSAAATDFIFCSANGNAVEPATYVALALAAALVALIVWATVYDYFGGVTSMARHFTRVRRGSDGGVVHTVHAPPAYFRAGSSSASPERRGGGSPRDGGGGGGGAGAVALRRPESVPLLDADHGARRGSPLARDEAYQSTAGEPAVAAAEAEGDNEGSGDAETKPPLLNFNVSATLVKVSLCFSFIQSFAKWRFYPRKHAAVNIFNSLRVLCWMWIVVTDTYTYTRRIPSFAHPRAAQESLTSRSFGDGDASVGGNSDSHNFLFAFVQEESCAAFAIATFCFISGFTTAHRLVVDGEEKRYSIPSRMQKQQQQRQLQLHQRQCNLHDSITSVPSVASTAAVLGGGGGGGGVDDAGCCHSDGEKTGASMFIGLKWYLKFLGRRWVRLAPLYASVIFFSQTTLLHVADGPFWATFVSSPALRENCQSSWAANLFFVNNLVPSCSKRCFPWSYYFALDFQFFALMPLVHVMYKRLPYRTLCGVVVGVALVSTIARFAQLLVDEGGIVSNGTPNSPQSTPQPGWLYQQPHLMLVAPLFGAILYYVYRALTELAENAVMFPGIPLSNLLTAVALRPNGDGEDVALGLTEDEATPGAGIALTVRVFEAVQKRRVRVFAIWTGIAVLALCVLGFWGLAGVPATNHGRIVAETFAILTWSLALVVVLLPMLLGFGGAIQRFLTHRLWCGASRLVFAAYLVHPVVISLYNATMTGPVLLQPLPFLYTVWGHTIVSLLVAFVLHLGIEQPCIYASQ